LRQAKRISVSGPGDWGSAEDFAAAASNWRVDRVVEGFWHAINTTIAGRGEIDQDIDSGGCDVDGCTW